MGRSQGPEVYCRETIMVWRKILKDCLQHSSNSYYGLASCRLARQGREIGWKSMLFQPISLPVTQGRGGLKAIITIAVSTLSLYHPDMK